MTDKQIIKALGCCSSSNVEECRKCPLISQKDELFSCLYQKQLLSLGLINRQKAEIERLKKNIDGLNIFTTNHMKVIRVQAIKEFAERLRNKIWYSDWCNFEKPITPEIITNLVQEMTEEK